MNYVDPHTILRYLLQIIPHCGPQFVLDVRLSPPLSLVNTSFQPCRSEKKIKFSRWFHDATCQKMHCDWVLLDNYKCNVNQISQVSHYYINVFSSWLTHHGPLARYAIGKRKISFKMIACCSITQTPTRQSKVSWWHDRKMVVIYFKRMSIHYFMASLLVHELKSILASMKPVLH